MERLRLDAARAHAHKDEKISQMFNEGQRLEKRIQDGYQQELAQRAKAGQEADELRESQRKIEKELQ